jgi:hypothetical protein
MRHSKIADGRPLSTIVGIMGRELGMDPRQVENRSDLANQVIVRNSLFKAK